MQKTIRISLILAFIVVLLGAAQTRSATGMTFFPSVIHSIPAGLITLVSVFLILRFIVWLGKFLT